MKIIKKSALPLIFILHLYPVLHMMIALILALLNTRWKLLYEHYPIAYAVIVFVVTLLGAIFRRQIIPEKGFGRACAPLLLPVALLNAIITIFSDNCIVFVAVLLSCVCALIIALAANSKKWKRVLSFVIAAVFALILAVMTPYTTLFGNSSKVTVVQKAKSPDKKYTAFLIDIYEDGPDRSTSMKIMKKPLPLPMGRFTTEYYGESDYWVGAGVLAEMTFEWLDNDTLLYGSKEIDMGE